MARDDSESAAPSPPRSIGAWRTTLFPAHGALPADAAVARARGLIAAEHDMPKDALRGALWELFDE
jgi:hypothetical protein